MLSIDLPTEYVVLKYPIQTDKEGIEFEIELPENSTILNVKTQFLEHPHIWCLVYSKNRNKLVKRKFLVIPTGKEFKSVYKESLVYIDTFMFNQGVDVFHLFEIKE